MYPKMDLNPCGSFSKMTKNRKSILMPSGLNLFKLLIMFFMFLSCNNHRRTNSLDKYGNTGIEIFEKGIISTSGHHEGLSYLSPERDVAIFTRSTKNFSESGIYISKFSDNEWSTPEKINLGNGNYQAGLAFSPDGKKAFFTNKIAITDRDSTNLWNVWEIEVNDNLEFMEQTAKPITSTINSESQDCCLTMNSNGKAFFSSDRDGTWDIYTADYISGSFLNIQKLKPPINHVDSGEWPSYISENGRSLYFSSIRTNGFGGDDIYVSNFSEGSWQAPKLMNEPINSASYEDSAILTKDHQFLFFASWRDSEFSKGVSNIYIQKNDGSKS